MLNQTTALKQRPFEAPLRATKSTLSHREGMKMINGLVDAGKSIKDAAAAVFDRYTVLKNRAVGGKTYTTALSLQQAAYTVGARLRKKRRAAKEVQAPKEGKVSGCAALVKNSASFWKWKASMTRTGSRLLESCFKP